MGLCWGRHCTLGGGGWVGRAQPRGEGFAPCLRHGWALASGGRRVLTQGWLWLPVARLAVSTLSWLPTTAGGELLLGRWPADWDPDRAPPPPARTQPKVVMAGGGQEPDRRDAGLVSGGHCRSELLPLGQLGAVSCPHFGRAGNQPLPLSCRCSWRRALGVQALSPHLGHDPGLAILNSPTRVSRQQPAGPPAHAGVLSPVPSPAPRLHPLGCKP